LAVEPFVNVMFSKIFLLEQRSAKRQTQKHTIPAEKFGNNLNHFV